MMENKEGFITKKELQQKLQTALILEKVISFILLFLLLAVPWAIYRLQIKMFAYPKLLLIRWGVTLMLSIFIIKKLYLGELNFRKTPLLYPLILFNFIVFLSVFKAKSLYLALWDYSNLFFYSLAFFIIVNHLKSLKELHFFQSIAILAGTVSALYGTFQFLGWDPIFPDIPITSSRMRIFSFFGNPNFFAGFLLIIMPLIFYRIFTSKGWGGKLFYFLLFLPYGVVLLATRTRSSWVALFVSIFFVFLILAIEYFLKKEETDRKKRIGLYLKRIFYLFITILVIIILIIPIFSKFYLEHKTGKSVPLYKIYEPYFERFYSIFNLHHVHTRQRILLWNVTLLMAQDNPFLGVGIGNFKQEYFKYQRKFFQKEGTSKYYDVAASPLRAHNEYIQFLGETGILGLSAFLLFIFTLYYLELKIYFKTEDDERKLFILFLLASLIAVLTHSLVSFPFHRPAVSFYFFIIAAFLTAENVLYNKEKLKKEVIYFEIRRIGKFEYIVIGLIAILTLFILNDSFKIFQANRKLKLGMLIAQRNPLDPQVEIMYKDSLRLDPNYGETHFRLAQYYQQIADYYMIPQIKRKIINQKFFSEKKWRKFVIARYHQALKEFEESLVTVDSRFTYFYMGLIWEKLADLERKKELLWNGYKLYKYIVEVMPNYTKAQYNFGVLCYKIVELFSKELKPKEKEKYFEEAKKSWEFAITYINELNKNTKKSVEYLRSFYNLAIYNFNHHHYATARKYLKKVLKLAPTNKDADKYLRILESYEKRYFLKAKEAFKKRKFKEARIFVKLVLEINPTNLEARKLFERLSRPKNEKKNGKK